MEIKIRVKTRKYDKNKAPNSHDLCFSLSMKKYSKHIIVYCIIDEDFNMRYL